MKRYFLGGLLIVGFGVFALTGLSLKEGRLRGEIEELKVSDQAEGAKSLVVAGSDLAIADIPIVEDEFKGKSLMEKVEILDHLSPADLKSLVNEIFGWKTKRFPSEKARLIYEPVMELACATIPEWFLLRTEEDWKAGKELVWWVERDERAFWNFLKVDPEAALRWYESGRFERPEKYYEKHELRQMAMAELLKRDPKRALELSREKLFLKDPGFRFFREGIFRFDDLNQVKKFREVVRQSSEEDSTKWSGWIARESYRLGGVAEVRELMDDEFIQNVGRDGKYSLLSKLGSGVKSEGGIRDLLELATEADVEVKAKIVGSYFGSWAWEDMRTAERLVDSLPMGRIREKATGGIIRAKAEFNPDGARALLAEISNERDHKELSMWIEAMAKARR